MNSFCCFSTVALACRDGTTSGLFIPRVILLTIGNSGTVVGFNSFFPAQSSLSTPGFSRSLACPLLKDSNSRIWDKPQWDLHVPPPILHCNCSRKLNTTYSGSLIFPKSTVSLIRALSSSCLHQFSAVPSSTFIKLICTTEFRYAATSVLGKAYVTAGP